MEEKLLFRLNDILDTIEHLNLLLRDKTLQDLQHDRITKAAFERFLEIISEATKHIPEDLKAQFPEIPWRRIKDLGNHLRHAYNSVDEEVLWEIYANGSIEDLRSVILKIKDT